jgi:hypothetical protein
MMSLLLGLSLSSCFSQGNKSVVGNTSGNINNGSRFLTLGDSIYFTLAESDQDIQNPETGFYKTNLNGTKIEKLFSKDLGALFFSGNTIVTSTGYDYNPSTGQLTRSVWAKEVELGSAFLVYGDLILYSNKLDQDRLYSIQRDGTKITKLTEVSVSKVDVMNGWIYYSTKDPVSLRRVKLNGKEDALVSEDAGSDFILKEDKIYYISLEKQTLKSMNLDGTVAKTKNEIKSKNINMFEDRVYYIMLADERVYSFVDGDGPLAVYPRSVSTAGSLFIGGDFVFFEDAIYPNRINKIHVTGLQSDFIKSSYGLGNVLGNTPGNINNGARMVEVNGWIYTSERTDLSSEYPMNGINPYGGLWRMRTDTSERERIIDTDVGSLYSTGGMIYTQIGLTYNPTTLELKPSKWANAIPYSTSGSFTVFDDIVLSSRDRRLYSATIDGSAAKIILDNVTITKCIVVGEWIYYVEDKDMMSVLHRMSLTGTNNTVVLNMQYDDYLIEGSLLYFRNMLDENRIYVKDLSTGTETKLNNVGGMALNSSATKLFYVNESDYYVYQMDKDGKNTKKISSTTTINILVVGDYLYYRDNYQYTSMRRINLTTGVEENLTYETHVAPVSSPTELLKGNAVGSLVVEKDGWIYGSSTNGLYRMKADGSSRTKISDHRAISMAILSDWIYFINPDHLNWIFRMKLDGSEYSVVSTKTAGRIIIKDEWIYFNNYGLSRVRTDGSGLKTLENGLTGYVDYQPGFYIDNNKIIYVQMIDDYTRVISRLDLDGKNKDVLIQGNNWLLNVRDSWIYYHVHDYSGMTQYQNYKMDFYGNHKTLITNEDQIDLIGTYDGWVYAYGFNRSSVFKMKADGSSKKVLTNINNEWIDSIVITSTHFVIGTRDNISLQYKMYSGDLEGLYVWEIIN